MLGELPEVGKRISATKKEQQYEFCTDEFLVDDYMAAKVLVLEAPIVIARAYMDYQLFQEQEGNKFLAVNRELASVIDVREIDFENEGMPSGPCMVPNGSALYWHNATGTLCIQLEELDKEAISIVELLHGLKVRRKS